ncbi:PEPxxWA-CTERM sorting domain-containing protein [Phenylobacterium sp.]|jgi:hypothetical protein|uniref:PEPxxWA-CTERM sorting domain-containing protein n=1 Tax=Phenylobacterium sp. TaxID=1871053 RepID=UPI002F42ABBA
MIRSAKASATMLAAGLAAAAMLAAGHAQAAIWVLDYTATDGNSPFEADLTLVTSDTVNSVGGYNVQSVTGDVDGDTVTALIANPGLPNASYSADGWFIYDNVFFADNAGGTAAPVLSNPGLLFASASGAEYNLFSDNATTYELYQARPGEGFTEHSAGLLTAVDPPAGGLGAIPEPAGWALMILGFGGAGALIRRRRANLATA